MKILAEYITMIGFAGPIMFWVHTELSEVFSLMDPILRVLGGN